MIDHVLVRRVALVLAALGVPTLLGMLVGLPATVSALLVVTALVAVAVMEYRLRPVPDPARTPHAPTPAPPAAATAETRDLRDVRDVPVDSTTPDYRFRFSATVAWTRHRHTSPDGHGDPGALAVAAVVARATRLAGAWAPADVVHAQHQLAATLGTAEIDGSGEVRAWATGVQLVLAEDDHGRLCTLADMRKDASVREHERDLEREERRYLGDDALLSTGSTLVWWLARHTDHVKDAVALVDQFVTLSAIAQNREVPPPTAPVLDGDVPTVPAPPTVLASAESLVEGLFPAPDDDRRQLFVDNLARLTEEFDHPDTAVKLRSAYDLPDPADVRGEPDDPPAPEANAFDSTDRSQVS